MSEELETPAGAAVATVAARKLARRTRTHRSRNGGFTVNGSLTPRRPREAREVAAAAGRLIWALVIRAEQGDLEALHCLAQLRPLVGEAMGTAATGLRVNHGYTWAQLGAVMSMTRQAAQQRWGRS